jgi:hypothetical protein
MPPAKADDADFCNRGILWPRDANGSGQRSAFSAPRLYRIVAADARQKVLRPHRTDRVGGGLSHRDGVALGLGFSFVLIADISARAALMAHGSEPRPTAIIVVSCLTVRR